MDNQQEQKFQEMTTAPVGRLICRLAVPCIISMLITSFYNMADTFFVGMLKSNAATGAVGVVFSRELGKHNPADAANMAATGFFSALPLAC